MNELADLRRELNRDLSRYHHASATLKEEKQRLATAKAHVNNVIEAQQHLQQLAQMIQQQSHRQIAKIVSRCLSAVFDNPYAMKIEFVRSRGKTEAKLFYMKDGHEVDPLRTSGGVLDISALALRIAELLLSTPQSQKFLVLDEPFGAVSAANLPKVAALLENLSREMAIQMLIVTHSELLQIGKVIAL